jgi:hypothetical protein
MRIRANGRTALLGGSILSFWGYFLCAGDPPGKPGFLRYTITGERFGEELGYAILAVGDVNGDGIGDLAIGNPQFADAVTESGKVLLVSGKDGSLIRSWGTDEAWHQYAQFLGNAGDIDGDGVTDVLAGNLNFVEQRSSRTGALLGTVYPGGNTLRGVGDVNKDGVPDFAVGNVSPPDSFKGRVTVYSGRTREVLWMLNGELDQDGFGFAIASLDDVDGDEIPDLALGIPGGVQVDTASGRLEIVRGGDGAEIYTITSGVSADGFGANLMVLSDQDGDGVRELAVCAINSPIRGLPHAGQVTLYNLRNRTYLWSQTGQDSDRGSLGSFFGGDAFGAKMGNAGDVDGDGIDDLIAWSARRGLAGADHGRVSLCSGKTGEILASYEAEKNETDFGGELTGLGDTDGDGSSEFAVGAREYYEDVVSLPEKPSLRRLGRVYVMSYRPEAKLFIRGDTDGDGRIKVTDAVVILLHLFQGGPAACEEAMDIDRNLEVNLTDALEILVYLVYGGMAPSSPFPSCGRFESFSPQRPCETSFCDRP